MKNIKKFFAAVLLLTVFASPAFAFGHHHQPHHHPHHFHYPHV